MHPMGGSPAYARMPRAPVRPGTVPLHGSCGCGAAETNGGSGWTLQNKILFFGVTFGLVGIVIALKAKDVL